MCLPNFVHVDEIYQVCCFIEVLQGVLLSHHATPKPQTIVRYLTWWIKTICGRRQNFRFVKMESITCPKLYLYWYLWLKYCWHLLFRTSFHPFFIRLYFVSHCSYTHAWMDYETMDPWAQICLRPPTPPTKEQDTQTERDPKRQVVIGLLLPIHPTLAQSPPLNPPPRPPPPPIPQSAPPHLSPEQAH